MAGYDRYSKSNNALAAEAAGRFPMTHAKKIVAKQAGVTQKTAAIVLELIHDGEWHHSSKEYNMVNYYDTNRAIEVIQKVRGFGLEPAKVSTKELTHRQKNLISDERRWELLIAAVEDGVADGGRETMRAHYNNAFADIEIPTGEGYSVRREMSTSAIERAIEYGMPAKN